MKTFKKLAVFIVLMLSACSAYGQTKYVTPKVSIGGISGPVDFGEMVILSADYDAAHPPAGMASIQFNWTIIDNGQRKNVFTADGGQKIAFAVGMRPRHITVVLGVNCLFESKQKIKIVKDDPTKPLDREYITEAVTISPQSLIADLQVGVGPEPAPTPIPVPPTPAPVFPDGQFGLAQFVYNAFQADTNLTPSQKALLATHLAGGLESIAARIVATNNYNDIATILADTKTTNDAAFSVLNGIDMEKTTALKGILNIKIYDLYKTQKKLNTAADLAKAWQELAVGLKAVKE